MTSRLAGHTGLALRGQRGITGIETAIVLIAFVVVAAVFAFAVLSSGLLGTEKSKETVLGSLEETQATLVLRGSVVANKNAFLDQIDSVDFQLGLAGTASEPVSLSSIDLIITYVDEDQSSNIGFADWTTDWLSGSSSRLDPGERVELNVDLTGLGTPLGPSKEFSIYVKPAQGAVLIVERNTPAELTNVTNLN